MPREDESTEDVYFRARVFTALLARHAEAESLADRGGTTIELEQDAWRGVEALARQAREDLKKLFRSWEEECEKTAQQKGSR